MKNLTTALCLALFLFSNGCSLGQQPAYKWTAKLKVVDEAGMPISGANASVQYSLPAPPGRSQEYGLDWGQITGETDKNGEFTATHTDSSWDLGAVVTKSGYYTTHVGHELYQPGQFDDNTVTASRNPSLTLVLDSIINPIPMYAKRLNLGMPAFDKPIGLDLMIGDWIAPYGKGVSSDIVFSAHLDQRTEFDSDYRLAVTFPNQGDGIQEFQVPENKKGSGLRSTHAAPTNGYISEWIQTSHRRLRTPIDTNRDPNRNYFIRVRTILDEKGRVKSALYGKIYGDFLEFTYYLNPTPNDPNVEFDPKQNLLGGLKSFEQVSAP